MRVALILACLAAPLPALAEIDPAPYRADFEACLANADTDEGMEACIGSASGPCMEREEDGMSTVGMMFCVMMEADLWDEQLNAVYQQKIKAAKAFDAREAQSFDGAYAVLEESLRDAQRAWIPFRDAQCALDYATWGAGSMRGIAGADCHMQMTAERVITLSEYDLMIAGE